MMYALIVLLLIASAPIYTLHKVLIGSPVRQKPAILKEFLQSLEELEKDTFQAHYCFVDDNVEEESSTLLDEFKRAHAHTLIIDKKKINLEAYECSESGHTWTGSLIDKVASFKDEIIAYAQKANYDYLFLIDSDLVLHPRTIERLISAKKDIISTIFWTKWMNQALALPQVWLKNEYDFYDSTFHEQKELSLQERLTRAQEFIDKLLKPGTYEVGGLGACTLISKYALSKDIAFKSIKNLSLVYGEDRFFCIRAVALGLDLFVDTYYPAYHIFRESALSGVGEYKQKNSERKIDVTCIGWISDVSIGKILPPLFNALSDVIHFNFIAIEPTAINEASLQTKKVITSSDKRYGKIGFFTHHLWSKDCDYSESVLQCPIKIANTLIEASGIPNKYVEILNDRFDAAVVPDPYLKEVFENCGVNKPIFVIPIALELEPFFKEPPQDRPHRIFTFGTSTSFWNHKNNITLVKAFIEEFGNNPRFALKIHTCRAEENIHTEILSEIEKNHITNITIYLQRLSEADYRWFLNSLDCYVLLSKGEGYSISPRHAMALGIPCILTNNTAHKTLCKTGLVRSVKSEIPEPADNAEIFGQECYGYQFGCTIEDAQEALRDVVEHYEEYLKKAKSAKEYVRQYDIVSLKSQYKTLFKPENIILSDKNEIESNSLMTNSIELFRKYNEFIKD